MEFPTDIEDVKVGGLGIHLVKKMADKMSYDYIASCNHLKIIKDVKI